MSSPSSLKLRIALAAVAALPAVGMAILVREMRWAPQENWDVLGILWLLTNLAPLTAWALLVLFVGLALFAWVHLLRMRR